MDTLELISFFVISGFVLTSSLYQKPNKNFKDYISGFYERRVKRLVPALSVFVLIASIAIWLFNSNLSFSLRTGLTSLFGLSNLYLLKQSTDYFAQSTELNIFTHTWSLGVEEQFYILFPFLIWFSGFGQQTKNGARNLFLTVGALTIASLIGFLCGDVSNSYMWEKTIIRLKTLEKWVYIILCVTSMGSFWFPDIPYYSWDLGKIYL